jgi:hypothetical protein
MKTKFLVITYFMLICYAINSNGQAANRTLSNLNSPTAVNQSLIPGTNNLINLGSGGRTGLNWNNLYLGNALYLKGATAVYAPGTGNFFAGINAGNVSVTGHDNSAIGQFSLFNLTSGNFNTATGYQALYHNTTGAGNIANGRQALFSNTTGLNNIATGHGALYSNISGDNNTAFGTASLTKNNGSNNAAFGNLALYSNTTGNFNSALGNSSLFNNTAGFNNTAIGSNADVSANNLFNATAIGHGAIVDASNKIRMGDGSVKSIGGPVGWTVFSDGRYKKDIKENVIGLTFINSLRPVTYTVNTQGLNEYYNKGRKPISNDAISTNEAVNAEMKKAEDEASKIVHCGFIAQEVEEAAKKLNFEFSGVDKPQSKDGLYGLRYDNFVVPIIKAVQELSHQNDELKNQNNDLQKQNSDLQKRIEKLEALMNVDRATTNYSQSPADQLQTKNLSSASLIQNVPNPFSNTTTVGYSLPQKFITAQIIITDKNGRQLKQLAIAGKGKGSVNLDAATLSSGTYNYSLIVDGKIITTKQMVLIK